MEILKAIRYVDEVVPQTNKNKFDAWEKYHFDCIFVGSDWKGSIAWKKIEDELSPRGVEIIYFDYTDRVSSTILRDKLIQE